MNELSDRDMSKRRAPGLLDLLYHLFIKRDCLLREPFVAWSWTGAIGVALVFLLSLRESVSYKNPILWWVGLFLIVMVLDLATTAIVLSLLPDEKLPPRPVVWGPLWSPIFTWPIWVAFRYKAWAASAEHDRQSLSLRQHLTHPTRAHLAYYLLAGALFTPLTLALWWSIVRASHYDATVYGSHLRWLTILVWGHAFALGLVWFSIGILVGGLVGLLNPHSVSQGGKWPLWLPGDPTVGWRILCQAARRGDGRS